LILIISAASVDYVWGVENQLARIEQTDIQEWYNLVDDAIDQVMHEVRDINQRAKNNTIVDKNDVLSGAELQRNKLDKIREHIAKRNNSDLLKYYDSKYRDFMETYNQLTDEAYEIVAKRASGKSQEEGTKFDADKWAKRGRICKGCQIF